MFLSVRRLATPPSLGQRVTGGLRQSWRLLTDRQYGRKKVDEWKSIARHTWESLKTGSKLFSKNVSISHNLMLKRAKGHGLTLQEHKLLIRTFSDTLKLVPFSFFIIVPFAELLLPFALWAFPNMLPSTFKDIISDDSWRVRRLRAKKEMAGFFEEALRARAERDRSAAATEEDRETFTRKQNEIKELHDLMVAHSGNGKKPFPEPRELIKFARLFREEFQLENMQLDQLKAICRLLGLSDRGFHSHMTLQLRHYLLKLLREDKEIRWEGVESLSGDDLKEACRARGMIFDDDPAAVGGSEKDMRRMLEHWLQLSSVKDMPLTLLLWSRVYAVSGQRELLDIHPSLTTGTADEDNARVLKYKARVETLLRQLKELEELEAATFAQQRQVIEGEVRDFGNAEDAGNERAQLLARITHLEEEVKSKRRLIDMQNSFLKQQIELIAKLREMPGLSLAGRGRQSKELRAELKNLYDQFDHELKLVEKAIRNDDLDTPDTPDSNASPSSNFSSPGSPPSHPLNR